MKIRSSIPQSGTAGFSLLELMIACSVLAVGILGGMGVICAASASNGSSKLNTAGATLAESTMERILAVPQNGTTGTTDCQGNNFAISTAPGGSGLTGGLFPGVDYTQPAVPNYSMTYITCAGLAFDVRWNVAAGPTPSTQLVTVSIKSLANAANPAAVLARKFTLHSLRGN